MSTAPDEVTAFGAMACLALVAAGAAVQVVVGAGLSVVCGFALFLWLGAAAGVPTLLCLNLVVSVVATALGGTGVRWRDAALASAAIVAGCLAAFLLPPLPETALKGMTACVLVAVALPRPSAPGHLPSYGTARAGIGLAALVAGALTVWTATPGPIVSAAMARGGWSGADIRQTMQPISVVGFGAALAWGGLPRLDVIGAGVFAGLIVATLMGTTAGFVLRPYSDPARVVLLVRTVALAAAALLVLSVLR